MSGKALVAGGLPNEWAPTGQSLAAQVLDKRNWFGCRWPNSRFKQNIMYEQKEYMLAYSLVAAFVLLGMLLVCIPRPRKTEDISKEQEEKNKKMKARQKAAAKKKKAAEKAKVKKTKARKKKKK